MARRRPTFAILSQLMQALRGFLRERSNCSSVVQCHSAVSLMTVVLASMSALWFVLLAVSCLSDP